jgi:hypothetical protein
MAKLPRGGWFEHCTECGKITSRISIVKYFGRRYSSAVHKTAFVCVTCRKYFAVRLLDEFRFVTITKETIAEQIIRVSNNHNPN